MFSFNGPRACSLRRMFEEDIRESILAFCNPGLLRTSTLQARNRTIGVVKVLIKKKDVNDYFAARRSRHPLSPTQASAVAATRPMIVKRDSKASGSAAPVDMPGSSAPTLDL